MSQARVEARFGGPFQVRMRSPAGEEQWMRGVFVEILADARLVIDVVAPHRLVYGYEMRLDEKKISVSLATMQLVGAEGGTTLKDTEQGAFIDGYDDAGSREQGTGHLLDALGVALAA